MKRKICLLFNAETKVQIAEIPIEDGIPVPEFDSSKILTKVVELGDSDYWIGDYDTGAIYSAADIPLVPQEVIKTRVSEAIYAEYNPVDQVNIIMEQLDAFIPEESKTEDFKAMVAKIQEEREKYRAKKEYYLEHADTYNWLSEDQIVEDGLKAFKGLTDIVTSIED